MAYPKIKLGNSVLIDLTSDTVSPENLKQGETAHDKRGESIVGTYTPVSPEIPTPTISVADSGLITAQCGDKSATHQLSSTDDADFVSANIKNGVTIFGTAGTYDGGGIAHAPTISVSDNGLVTAECGGESATHQLSASDDADFISANIKNGVTIFGIAGTYDGGGSGSNIQTGTMTLDTVQTLPTITVSGTCSHVLVYPSDGQTIDTNNVFFLYADAANAGADAYSIGGNSITGNTYGEGTLPVSRRTVFNDGSIRLGTPPTIQWAAGNYTWLAW